MASPSISRPIGTQLLRPTFGLSSWHYSVSRLTSPVAITPSPMARWSGIIAPSHQHFDVSAVSILEHGCIICHLSCLHVITQWRGLQVSRPTTPSLGTTLVPLLLLWSPRSPTTPYRWSRSSRRSIRTWSELKKG